MTLINDIVLYHSLYIDITIEQSECHVAKKTIGGIYNKIYANLGNLSKHCKAYWAKIFFARQKWALRQKPQSLKTLFKNLLSWYKIIKPGCDRKRYSVAQVPTWFNLIRNSGMTRRPQTGENRFHGAVGKMYVPKQRQIDLVLLKWLFLRSSLRHVSDKTISIFSTKNRTL